MFIPHLFRATTRSGTLVMAALLTLATACGDDGSTTTTNGSSSTSGEPSTSTTRGVADSSTSSATAASSDTGTTSNRDTDTDGDSSTTSGSDSSSGSSGTGTTVVDVPFEIRSTFPLARSLRAEPGWTVIETAEQWAMLAQAPVPKGVSFPEQWVVYGSRGPLPFPGHRLGVSALSWDGSALTVEGNRRDPGPDCSTYEFTWPADVLLVIDALDGTVRETVDETTQSSFGCAAGGGRSGDCSIGTPCGPGLLCAGLIRSTVLIDNPGGLCLPESYRGVFEGDPVVIPDNGTTVEVPLDVAGLTTVDMDVVIWVDVLHPAPEELVIELRNPDGNQVSVANLQAEPLHPGGIGIVPTGFSGDESVNGEWALVIRDDIDNGANGEITGWRLEIMSRFD